MGPWTGNTTDAMKSNTVCTKQKRIAQLAERHRQLAFTSLNHYIDMDWLEAAYRRTRKDGAVGIDGQTAEAYSKDLQANLESLLNRAKSGRYRAPPVKRGYVPKEGKEKRPIGMPTFEDKVLQRAVVMVMEPIYEHDFLDCSYGFRPGHSPHQALAALWKAIMEMDGCTLVDVDIRKYFDSVEKKHIRAFVRQRVRDGVIGRLIGKWLKAGVWEEGRQYYPETGTPQGGVISPLLSNIYLHEVLDQWFEQQIKPRLQGRAFLIRFADDAVMGFEYESDAERVREVLPKRFGKYGLTIHPEKTRMVDFRRPPTGPKGKGTFDFLGFTHYWGKSRRGRMVVKRKTMKRRLSRAMQRAGQWCKHHRHSPLEKQQAALRQKLQGHYGYYGINGNSRSLRLYYQRLQRHWRYWLSRRSRNGALNWERFRRLLVAYPLPPPRILHSDV